MKLWKIVTAIEAILFIVGALFLWFRKVDGSGVANTTPNKLVSIGLWAVIFLFLFAVQTFWHHSLQKKQRG